MTNEQKAAISHCIEAFNIPRDCRGFTLKIYTGCPEPYSLGDKQIAVTLEVDHLPASPGEV